MKAQSLKYQFKAFMAAGALLCVVGSGWSNAHAQGKGVDNSSSKSGVDNSSSKSSSTSSSSKSDSSNSSKSSSSSSNASKSGGDSSRSGGSSSSRSSGGSGRENRSSGGSNRSSSSGSSASSGNSGSGSVRAGSRHENRNRDRDNGSSRGSNNTVRSENRIRDRSGEGSSLSSSTANNRSRDKDRGDRNGDGRRGHHDHWRGFDRGRDGNFSDWHRHECERGRHYYPTRVYEAVNYNNYGYGLTAYEQGYEDGLRTGASDAWRGESYDPERSHFYKHGAGGFLSIFGNRATYASAYRDGFLRGYEEGYQNYSSYFIGGKFRR